MRNNKLGSSGIGGQAVMEGIMMRNKEHYAVAVRQSDGSIIVDTQEYKGVTGKSKKFQLPFIRGIFSFVDSLVLGIKTLTYSAQFFDDDENFDEEPGQIEKWLLGKVGDKAEKVIMGLTVAFSVIIAVALFMVLPLFIADLMEKCIPWVKTSYVPAIEGVVKILIFIGYLILISLMKDIKRTFMYHGAEHKCINCVEHGLPLTVDNVLASSRLHKRCGTSFLFLVMLVSIFLHFIFVLVPFYWVRLFGRLLMVPVVAGISFEIIQWAGRSDSKLADFFSKPGLAMQKLTTKEPTADMAEVAIRAVEAVFDWKAYLKEEFGVEAEQ